MAKYRYRIYMNNLASVGFGGVARILDRGVQTIQSQSKELAQ